jgi:hypothetical protein
MFLRNVHLSPNYKPLQSARPYSRVTTGGISNATGSVGNCKCFARIRFVFSPVVGVTVCLDFHLNVSYFKYVMLAFFQICKYITFQPHLTFIQFVQLHRVTNAFTSECVRRSLQTAFARFHPSNFNLYLSLVD